MNSSGLMFGVAFLMLVAVRWWQRRQGRKKKLAQRHEAMIRCIERHRAQAERRSA